jgi:parvulin-like peptidyl-prolyl isomerase
LALGACGGEDAVPSDAVAIVGDRVVSVAAYERALDEERRAAATAGRRFPEPGTPSYRRLSEETVAALVERARLEEKAAELRIDVSERVVAAQVAKASQEAGGTPAFRQWLARSGRTPLQFYEEIAVGMLRAAIARKVAPGASVGEAELRVYYRRNASLYRVAPMREIRHILVDTRVQAAALRLQIMGGADFAKVARRHSRDVSSRQSGGRLLLQYGLSESAFQQAAFALPEGAVSGPVRSEFGFHLIQPVGRVTPERVRPFSEVREPIRRQLLEETRRAAFKEWMDKVERELEPRYREPFVPGS